MQKIDRLTGLRKKIGWSTVRQRFTDFLAAWQQRPGNKKIEDSKSIYNVRITPTLTLSTLLKSPPST
jgi:hypothetical protein